MTISEHTDIVELLGGDQPVDEQNGSGDGTFLSFEWCDGVLLKAMKEGHWVLFEELNLAS